MFKIGDIVRLTSGTAHMRVEGVGTRDGITYYICRYINSDSRVPRREEVANRLVLVEAGPTPPKAPEPTIKWYKPSGKPASYAYQVEVAHVRGEWAMIDGGLLSAPILVKRNELSEVDPRDEIVAARFYPHGRGALYYWAKRGMTRRGDLIATHSGDVMEIVDFGLTGSTIKPIGRITGHLVGPSELT